MIWDDFYDRYCDWSESTVRTRISSLEDIGEGGDVVDVVLNLSDEKIKVQLIRKAMKLGVKFTHDDFAMLDGELPDEVYAEVAAHGGFYLDNPCFDEHDFDWDDFYGECGSLPDDMVLRCIPRIQKFGARDEVVDAILSLSAPADDALYERAIACGVRFTKAQLAEMGRDGFGIVEGIKSIGNCTEKELNNFAEQIRTAEKRVDADVERLRRQEAASAKKKGGKGSFMAFLKDLFGNGTS